MKYVGTEPFGSLRTGLVEGLGRCIQILLILLAWAVSIACVAQSYPVKLIRYIVPFPAAATPDIIARTLAERLSRQWGLCKMVVSDSWAQLPAPSLPRTVHASFNAHGSSLHKGILSESLFIQTPGFTR